MLERSDRGESLQQVHQGCAIQRHGPQDSFSYHAQQIIEYHSFGAYYQHVPGVRLHLTSVRIVIHVSLWLDVVKLYT